ncbi:cobalamin B12-binding domain-containing protein [Microbispora triticiradicis]|uniref:cobalamin B12-binding domain-containing protein n=1 Tax=Microbispora triticiradicis TaxID=2200763 RepID=UPI001FCCD624|nr:cobalamin-dependent protein [Microbispora triticiradicis]
MTQAGMTGGPAGAGAGTAVERYLELIGEADEYGAVDLVLGLIDEGVPAEDVLLRVVAAGQRRVGELWAAGDWSVAREHGATAVSERAVAAIAGRVRPRPTRGRVTVACADGEYHALPTRILAEVLRLRGWRVDFLGASVPGPHLITHLHQTGPDVVALGCMIATRLPRAHATIAACRAVGVPVLAGGAAFGADGRFARLLGADAWAPTADAAADRLAAGLPSFAAGSDGAVHLGDEEYGHLTRHRAEVLARVLDLLKESYTPIGGYSERQLEHTAEDLGHIADFLAAALYVHDTSLFTDFVTWTCEVLSARKVPAESVVLGLRLFRDVLADCPRAGALLAAGMEAATASRASGGSPARVT